ncbi:hypothetical protein ACLOJK_005441 [Asimina triloba]
MASSKGSQMSSLLLLFAAAAVVSLGVVSAQNSETTCASSLVPCAAYLNSSSPSAECCTAIKNAVSTQLTCLCKLFSNKEILKNFNVNVTQALELPKHCGVSADLSACNQGAPAPTAGGPPGTFPPFFSLHARQSGNTAGPHGMRGREIRFVDLAGMSRFEQLLKMGLATKKGFVGGVGSDQRIRSPGN